MGNGATDLHALGLLYLGSMLIMAIISPIVSIISQIAAVLIIQRVQKWWAARKATKHESTSYKADGAKELP